MSKRMFMEIVRDKTGCTHAVAREAAAAMFQGIAKELKTSGRFAISGFGVFTVRKMKARKGVNPATGEAIKIKAGKTVRFKASPHLKSAV